MNKFFLKNRYNLKIIEYWFCDDYKNLDDDCDIQYIYGYKTKVSKATNHLQKTLILDLLQDEDTIFENIRKNVKYEINRCIKENILFKIYTSEDLRKNSSIVSEFEKVYNMMYTQKGMSTRLNLDIVNEYIDKNSFILTAASNGTNLCYHAYITDSTIVRLLYSCSTFRDENQEEKNLVARANKFLHWEDLKYFKSIGVSNYDFGGVTSFDNPNGIDKFKMAFGGSNIEYYNITISKTLKGKLYLLARKLLKR